MTGAAKTELTGVRQLYEDSLDRHGAVSAGVGWPDPAAHRLRFEKLGLLIDRHDPVSVNDLGCGYGAFLPFLRGAGVNVARFRGYDISERMIERARVMEPDGEYVISDTIDMDADYSFACGIFNVRLETPPEAWDAHVQGILDNLAERSKAGFAFNMLSTYVDFRAANLHYADPGAYFDLCKRRYSKKVALLHDYPLYEWTMLVRL